MEVWMGGLVTPKLCSRARVASDAHKNVRRRTRERRQRRSLSGKSSGRCLFQLIGRCGRPLLTARRPKAPLQHIFVFRAPPHITLSRCHTTLDPNKFSRSKSGVALPAITNSTIPILRITRASWRTTLLRIELQASKWGRRRHWRNITN